MKSNNYLRIKKNRYYSSLALMDLCDEADTTNDGKISIEEYLTIAKNYGIKVFIPDCFLFWFFSAVQRWYRACRGSRKQQQRTLKEWLYFPHQGIDCSFHLDIPNLLQRESFSSICDSVTHWVHFGFRTILTCEIFDQSDEKTWGQIL